MDISAITAAIGAISAAKELGKAAIGVRDFNEVAPVIAQLNNQLLKAQDALFAHNAQLFALQQENFEAAKKLREMEETLAQRGRYSLFQIARGIFVYRVNVAPESSEMSDPRTAEPAHYVCQPCFDKGIKSVLQRDSQFGAIYWGCRVCSERYHTGETEPYEM